MPKVSVIIPVYNVEKYLSKCLKSVINQTLKDIEIICVEDCSSDNSCNILESYSTKDPRIKVFYNETNRGLSYTRNRGIQEASGEYIQFLDSDDYLDLDALDCFYKIAYDDDLDVLISDYVTDYSDESRQEKNNSIIYPASVKSMTTGKKVFAELIYSQKVTHWCFAVLIFSKADFLKKNNILFIENILHEDIPFFYKLMHIADRCKCVNYYKYHYVQRSNSIVHVYNQYRLESFLIILEELLQYNAPMYDDNKISAEYLYILNLIKRINSYCSNELKQNYDFYSEQTKNLFRMIVGKGLMDYSVSYITEKIANKLKNKKVFVYGAGEIAKHVIYELDRYNVEIEKIIVSSQSEKKHLLGYEIVLFNDVNLPNNYTILVATSKKFQHGIAEILKKCDIDQIVFVT